MAVNHYFQTGVPQGRSSEQLLVEDLVIECLKIYGFETNYLTRKVQNLDGILNEDPLNNYENSYQLEMYLKNIDGRSGTAVLSTRPAEGDIVYFPLTKSYFEIKYVEALNPFFQLGKLYVYELTCELLQYSSERIVTGVDDIDSITTNSLDVLSYEFLLENGDLLNLEYETLSSLILESYNIENIDLRSQNENFEAEISVLDFTERNPFGEVQNQ